MKKCIEKMMLSWVVLLLMVLPAWALDFELTPAGAELLRERGSVGFLYWGLYREC